jgi:hypothetical protein
MAYGDSTPGAIAVGVASQRERAVCGGVRKCRADGYEVATWSWAVVGIRSWWLTERWCWLARRKRLRVTSGVMGLVLELTLEP